MLMIESVSLDRARLFNDSFHKQVIERRQLLTCLNDYTNRAGVFRPGKIRKRLNCGPQIFLQ